MSKKIIGLEHNSISPDITGVENDFSEELHLERGKNDFLTVYVDNAISSATLDSKHNVAMLIEPIVVSRANFKWIEENYDQFDMILTHHQPLLRLSPKFRYYPVWPRIKMDRNNWKIYPKKKSVSVIFSNKNQTSSQEFRHSIVKRFKDKLDLYGTGYQYIDDKVEGTGDYRYQVVVENIFSGYVSEKANDCFACGTIPIYHGDASSNINDFYDPNGFVLFETLDELDHIINNVIDEEYYLDRTDAIAKNYNLAIHNTVHTTLWNCGIKEFFNE